MKNFWIISGLALSLVFCSMPAFAKGKAPSQPAPETMTAASKPATTSGQKKDAIDNFDPSTLNAKDKKVYDQLVVFAGTYLKSCNVHISPNKKKPAVTQREGLYVASYMEVEEAPSGLQLIPSKEKTFSYISRMRYSEHVYECTGKTKQEALAGPFQRVQSKRLTEMPRYVKNKWIN